MAHDVLDRLAVLADGTRARLLALLDGHELTVSELCDIVRLPQSTVSRHLKTLSDGGWAASRRDGTSRYYTLPIDDLEPASRRIWLIVREQVLATATADQDERRLKMVLSERRTTSEAFFSSVSGQWDRVREELFGASSSLWPLLGLVEQTLVVGDLGCGTGQVAAALAPFVARVVAVDASAEMLHTARARLAGHANVELRRGALERLPLDDGVLDAALLLLVLHHVADPGKVLTEASRVVKPGGRLVVADMTPHEHEDYRQTMGHVWLGFGERQFGRYAAGAGFEGVRWNPLPADPRAKGPALFVATATRPASTRAAEHVRGREPASAR